MTTLPLETLGQKKMRQIIAVTLVVGAFMLMIMSRFYPGEGHFTGMILGLVLALANYIFLTKIVVKILKQDYTPGAKLAEAKLAGTKLVGLFVLKMAFMAGLVYFAFWVIQVDVLAFVLGYMNIIPGLLFQQFFGS